MELVKTNYAFPAENNTWDAVRYWAGMSLRFKQADLACQVMAGFALKELRALHGPRQGQRSDLKPTSTNDSSKLGTSPAVTSTNDSSKLGFQEMVLKETGISHDTARNWMKMADGIKSRWKKLPIRDRLHSLMAVPPSQWQDDDAKLITDALHKATDGRTQLEFMWELGLAKKPQGAGARGRKPGEGGRAANLDVGDEDELLKEFRFDMKLFTSPNDTTLQQVSTATLLQHRDEAAAYLQRIVEILKRRKQLSGKVPAGSQPSTLNSPLSTRA